jgi:hypothetical protein
MTHPVNLNTMVERYLSLSPNQRRQAIQRAKARDLREYSAELAMIRQTSINLQKTSRKAITRTAYAAPAIPTNEYNQVRLRLLSAGL